MSHPLQPFDEGSYERPNQPYSCGNACEGVTCQLGPTPSGSCQAGYACTPQQKGTGWVCTYKFNHHFLMVSRIIPPVIFFEADNLGQSAIPFLCLDSKVDKARTRYLRIFNEISVVFEMVNYDGRDLPGASFLA